MKMYYILENQYEIFEKGTVIFHHDGKLTCLNEISIPFEGSIPNSWHSLSEKEAHFLNRKTLSSRLKLHQNKAFEIINQLKVGDDCLFITNNEQTVCKILERLENSESLQFVIKDSKGEKKTVCASFVELIDLGGTNLLQTMEDNSPRKFIEYFGKPFFNESCSNETLDKLSTIFHKKSFKKVLKVIWDDVFINSIKTQLSDYKPVISGSKPKQDLHIDFVEKILQILNRECREDKATLAKIRNSRDLVVEIERVLNDMTKMTDFSSKEKEILLAIISVYFHIVKSSECDHSTMINKFIEIFNSTCHDIRTKIGSSVCLSFIIKDSHPLLGEIQRFLKGQLVLENKSDNTFNRDDIFMALGRISSIESYQDQIVVSNHDDQIESCSESILHQESQSSDWLPPSNEEYKRCLLVLTKHMTKTLACKEAVDCASLAERMSEKKILPNFLINTESPISLGTYPVVIEYLIRMNDDNDKMTVLGNCETSPEVYERLLTLAQQSGKEVATLIASKIKSECVSPDFNQKLLLQAFDYLDLPDMELFKCFMEKSADRNGFLGDGDTFLIKMIRSLDLSQMRKAMAAFTFDVNTPNKSKELPISIAAEMKDVEKIKLLRSQKDQTVSREDLHTANRFAYQPDLDKETSMKIADALK